MGKYKFPLWLMAFYVTFLLLTVCLANRFFEIAGTDGPGGIFVFPLAFFILDITAEVYGYTYSRLFIWIGALCELLFSIVTIFVSHLPSPEYFNLSLQYQTVFDPTLQFVISTLIGTLVGEFSNIYFLTKWKIKFHGQSFILRTILATALGQLLLSIIVDVLAFSNKLSLPELTWLIFCGYSWKMVYSIILVYPSWLIVKKLKSIDKIDNFDINIDFNPFKIALDDGINQYAVFETVNLSTRPMASSKIHLS